MNWPDLSLTIRKYLITTPTSDQKINQNKAENFRITSGWLGPKVIIYPEILFSGKWYKFIYNGQTLVCSISRMLSPTRENQIKDSLTEFMKDWFRENNLTRKGPDNKEKIATLKALEDKKRKEKKEVTAKEKKEQREAEIARYKASLERQDSGSGTRTN
jgi:hypothetical protein